MKIPFFGIAREYRYYSKEYLSLIDEVLSHGQVLRGKEVERFEAEIAKRCERKYAVAVNSATDALFFSLVANNIGPGDEVLVSDFSFIASASSIQRSGAKPVFVDVGEDYNIELTKAREKITDKTKAIVVVHLYGKMINPTELENFARGNNLIIIEDAAQAYGAEYNGRAAGSIGSVSCFSFDPTKVLGAISNGGVALTDDDNIADRIKRLRYHGKNAEGEFESLGYNSQMASAVANLLLFKMDKTEEWFIRRKEIAKTYTEELKQLSDLIVPQVRGDHSHIFHKYVLRAKRRDELRKALTSADIQVMIHYGLPLHANKCFHQFGYKDDDYSNSMEFSKTVLSLPIHPFLENEEVEKIISTVTGTWR